MKNKNSDTDKCIERNIKVKTYELHKMDGEWIVKTAHLSYAPTQKNVHKSLDHQIAINNKRLLQTVMLIIKWQMPNNILIIQQLI